MKIALEDLPEAIECSINKMAHRRTISPPWNIDGRPGLPSPQSMKVSQVEIAAIDPDFTEATASIPDGIR
ncbi:hypothetical protein ACE1BJ_24455 [Aeromonas jandaei]